MSVDGLFDLIQTGGIIALLLIIMVAGTRQVWVWGWLYREMKADRDWWRGQALATMGQTEAAIDTADEVVVNLRRRPRPSRGA